MSTNHESVEKSGYDVAQSERIKNARKGPFHSFFSKVLLGTEIGALGGGLVGAVTLNPLGILAVMALGAGAGALTGAGVHIIRRTGGR